MQRALPVLGVFVAALTAALARAAEPPALPLPETPEPIRLTDDFETDSRSEYASDGTLQWQRGKLTLDPGSSVGRQVDAGATATLRLDLQWPPLTADNRQGETRFVFDVGKAGTTSIHVSRQWDAGKETAGIQIVDSYFSQEKSKQVTTVIRQFPSADGVGSDPWTLRYHHGMVKVTTAGKMVAIGYIKNGATPVAGWQIEQVAGQVGLAEVSLAHNAAPAPLTPQQDEQLAEAKELALEMIRLFKEGKYQEAETVQKKSRRIRKLVLGEEHPLYASSLNNLAYLYEAIAEYAKAEPLYLQALELRRKVLGEEHPLYAVSLNNLALLYQSMGGYAKAEPLFVQSLEIRRRVQGEEHASYTVALNNLALLYVTMGDYAEAERMYLESQEIRREIQGEEHTSYAIGLDNLASLYRSTGDYAKAEPLCLQAKEIWRKARGEEHPEYAVSLNNLAGLYKAMGDYTRAEPLYVQSMEIRRKVFGEKHPSYAASLNNLALLYYTMGDHAKAEPLFVQSKAIRRKVLGEEHPDYASSLNNLAFLYKSMRAYDRAEPLFVQSREIRRKVLGTEHPACALALNNLAGLYESMGARSKAEPLYAEALEIRRRALGEEHPDYAISLNNLALLYTRLGAHARAEPLFVQATKIRRSVLGERHPDYAASQNNLAGFYRSTGDYAKAAVIYRQALDNKLTFAKELLEWLPEARAMALLQRGQIGRDPLLSVLRLQSTPDHREAYSAVWRTHSLVTRALRQRQRSRRRSPEAEALYQQLQATGEQLAQLTLAVHPPSTTPSQREEDNWRATRRQRLSELNDQKERLESQLAKLSQEFRRTHQVQEATPRDLARELPPDTAVVDIVRAAIWSPADGTGKPRTRRHYEAFVLRPAKDAVRQSEPSSPGAAADHSVAWVHLGPAASIDAAIGQWREAIRRSRQGGLGPEAAGGESGDSPPQLLRRVIWEKLEPHLAGCGRVIIVPDGDLTRLPWAALPGRRPGSYLVEDYALGTAGSGQQLYAQLTEPSIRSGEALLVGGVEYGEQPTENLLAAADRPMPRTRGPSAEELPKWSFLAGTATEVATLGTLYNAATPGRVLQGTEANEYLLRQAMPTTRYLHLATHGFFADAKFRSMFHHDPESEQLFGGGQATWDDSDPLVTASRAGVTARNPLILSGVVLAGANLPPPTDELGLPTGADGIMTAEEVAALDLRETELVVLSACETGLGKVAGGEGILGLQRAFGLAGARTTVASLWKVDDDATQALMVELYKNLWQQKLGKLQALRQAQLTMLRGYEPAIGQERGTIRRRQEAATKPPTESAGKRQPLPPYYWAAFVLNGDWR